MDILSNNKINPLISLRTSDKPRVAIGMSGGVDSSVAAKILKDQGYDVVGFMMKLWSEPKRACQMRDNACCDIDGLQDAKRIATILDIPFYVVDVREKFKKEVVDYFIEEYKNLRTPNPCAKCNEKIKFGWLLDFAKKVGCDYLATGHYARIKITNSKQDILKQSAISEQNENIIYHLLKGKDANKDQSYFLHRLKQDQLSKIIFPVGEYTKDEVRGLAKKWNLPVAGKRESQEICFVTQDDYRQFLRQHIPKRYFNPGEIVDTSGNVIGRHEGLINYTIGQRKGIEQSVVNRHLLVEDKRPLYVLGFNIEKNQLIVGKDGEIYKEEMTVCDLNWINQDIERQISGINNLSVKIRYRHPAVKASIQTLKPDSIKVVFNESQRAITPGQSAVFYNDNEVLGGGVIS